MDTAGVVTTGADDDCCFSISCSGTKVLGWALTCAVPVDTTTFCAIAGSIVEVDDSDDTDDTIELSVDSTRNKQHHKL